MTIASDLVSQVLADIDLQIPWDEIKALPGDVLVALQGGDTAPLRSHVAEALDKAVDLSKIPVVGKMAESEQAALSAELVDKVADTVTTEIVGAPIPHGKVAELAAVLVPTADKAAKVLAMGPIYRAAHPALVKAARAVAT